MPRQARLDVPGALHHIMVRGINKAAIFQDKKDREKFLERLGQNVTDGKCTVYAYVLMSNHVHILFKSGREGISSVMRKLLTWYAQRGQLWDGDELVDLRGWNQHTNSCHDRQDLISPGHCIMQYAGG